MLALLGRVYIGKVYCDKADDSDKQQLQATLIIVLVLATVGNATHIGLFLFLVAPPKVAKESTVALPKVTVTCCCLQRFCQQMPQM
jgi:hypothetical protein